MATVVQRAITDKRKQMADMLSLLRVQMQPVKDDLKARETEIDGVQADIDALDAWLGANT